MPASPYDAKRLSRVVRLIKLGEQIVRSNVFVNPALRSANERVGALYEVNYVTFSGWRPFWVSIISQNPGKTPKFSNIHERN